MEELFLVCDYCLQSLHSRGEKFRYYPADIDEIPQELITEQNYDSYCDCMFCGQQTNIEQLYNII